MSLSVRKGQNVKKLSAAISYKKDGYPAESPSANILNCRNHL